MNDHEFLLDAMEQIDDDLIREAAQPHRKRNWLPVIAAAAACLVLAVGLSIFLQKPDAQPRTDALYYAENLWQKEDFQVYSLSYRTGEPSLLSHVTPTNLSTGGASVSSKNLTISTGQTIKFETLIAQRYAVFYSDTGYPIFYDTQEDQQVDLQERILGDTTGIFMQFMEDAEAQANLMYPGMLQSETNRRLFWEYLYCIGRDLPLQDIVEQTPDTDFMNELYDWYDKEIEAKNTEFWTMCWASFVKADADVSLKPYSINILGIDAAGGQCILRANDIYGNGMSYLLYDIKTDTCRDLPATDTLINMMAKDGYIFRFSSDSAIATIASPHANFSGGNLYLDLTQRFTVPSEERYVSNYLGEDLGVMFLSDGKAMTLSNAAGASELFISESNGILYYKRIEASQAGKSFHASDAVWFNRLNLYNKDTDYWIFHTVSDNTQVSNNGIILQGNFVRFAAEETVVIMERGGSYFAYSLADGSDITAAVTAGSVPMFAHEQMLVYLQDGKLYRRNLFLNTPAEIICTASKFALSSDGAFAFTYNDGDRYVTCYNVATGENCTIAMEEQLCQQLFSTEGAVLQMNYNAEDNTLLLSFYTEADQNLENTSDVDFYQMLEQLNDRNPDDLFPENPTVVTGCTISDELMDLFRDSVDRYRNPNGVISWETYYPEFLSVYEDLNTICQKLGLNISTTDLDVNGTQFILYQDEDETLTLTFYQFWGLFDYNDTRAGFEIRYNDTAVRFTFVCPSEDGSGSGETPTITLPFEIPPPPEPGSNVAMPDITIPAETASPDKLEQLFGAELFSPDIMAAQATALSAEDRQRILSEVESLLERKNYTKAANQLILDSVEQLCHTYPNYRNLFAFLDVPDTETYIRQAVIECLDAHVDTICFPCQHSDILDPRQSDGRGVLKERTLHITLTNDASINAAMLMKALGNIRSGGNDRAYNLVHGYSAMNILTLTNASRFQYLSSLYDDLHYQPENASYTAYSLLNNLQYSDEVGDTGTFFRLFVLTDYETIERFIQSGDDQIILSELVRRYGEDGRTIYQRLTESSAAFGFKLERESLFLKLFLKRLDEVQTAEEMASYLQLYRLYRKFFSTTYIVEPYDNTYTEQNHPLLDYESADWAVAQAAVNHSIFNNAAVPREMQLMVAYGIVNRPLLIGGMHHSLYKNEYERTLGTEPIMLIQPRIKIMLYKDSTYNVSIHSSPGKGSSFRIDVNGES